MRKAVVSGSFYEHDKDKLNLQLEKCFEKISKKTDEKIKAIIVPHAGYFFSGKCAAKAYSQIEGNSFVIFGPNHFGYETGISDDTWETPFGKVEIDKILSKEIEKKSGIGINDNAHIKEHSIEVQLPFLQYSQKKFSFVPISFGSDIDPHEFGKKLKFLLEKNVTMIVSSDFTHYGPSYGYLPFVSDIKNNLKKLDMDAIDIIKKKDFNGFKEYLEKTGITICGYIGILVLLAMIEDTDYGVELLDYYTSGDVVGDFRNSVSYASLAIK